MLTEGPYQDSPLVLAERELTKVTALLKQVLDQGEARFPDRPGGSPGQAHGEAIRAEALRELVPRWHFGMLNDFGRNSLLQEAIENIVGPGDHVLDIGSGSGLLAMVAARAGAGRVTSCELVRPIAQAARRIVAANGLQHIVEILNKGSDELTVGDDLPRPADVVVTEIVDCGLVGEGLLPTLRNARASLLKPAGTIIPRQARLVAVPVESTSIWQLNRVDFASGFDVSHFNEFASARYFQVRLRCWSHRMLSAPRTVLSFDFLHDPLEPGHRTVDIPIRRSGTCHGIAFWFELDLDGKRTLSNEPTNRTSHWHQAFQCLPEPLLVAAGKRVRVRVDHTDDLVYFTPLT